MADAIKADLCVIGAGSGGLSVAAGAAMLGQKVVLIEKGEMGGDCLNTGCVPSKALIAAAHRAHAVRAAAPFGIVAHEPAVDFGKVMDHVHAVIAEIAPTDSQARFEGLGCTVIRAPARFADRRTVDAGGKRIRARIFVIATGSRAAAPPIPGLADTPYLTNETVFENRVRPGHLIVIGAGPIGLELAQAHRRLGSRVTVLEGARALAKDEPEAAAIVLEALRAEEIDVREGVKVTQVAAAPGGVAVTVEQDGRTETLTGSHLLVAAGRKPNVEDLNLAAAGVAVTRAGVTVNKGLRTTNRRIYALGDVAGGPQFTHAANYHAGILIRRALFWVPAKVDYAALPWCTYTDPELAQVGLTEEAARAKGIAVRILRWPLIENDRARAEREHRGLAKIVVDARGRILGAAIVAPRAGELIQTWTLAIANKLRIGAFAKMIAPYPTLGEIGKRAASSFFTGALFAPRTRALVKFLARFG